MPTGIAHLGLQPGLVLPGAVGVKPTDSDNKFVINTDEINFDTLELIDDSNRTVECKLQECPAFLHDEMMQLFPETTITRGELRIIILTEKTQNDMTSWSPAVEEEREKLLEHVRNTVYRKGTNGNKERWKGYDSYIGGN